jgi:hypothetical protein
MKEIYFTKHALKQMTDRKATEDEVKETIRKSEWKNEMIAKKVHQKYLNLRRNILVNIMRLK